MNSVGKMSDGELIKLYETIKDSQEFEENQADVKKILLNSFYGSGALETNPFSSGKLTNASVTIAGRCMNKMTGVSINNWINSALGKEPDLEISDIIQSDTDSVTGDSIIHINDTPIKIEDYFNNNNPLNTKSKEVIKLNSDVALSFNVTTEEIENKQVKYVMRHKTKKKLYRITSGNNEITVTEDHSIIIKRDGEYLDIKPNEIKDGDVITVVEE